jgi:uncharacterized membrane protein
MVLLWQIFDLVSVVGLLISLLVFAFLTFRTWKSGREAGSSLRFQLVIVVIFWLASEVSVLANPFGGAGYGGYYMSDNLGSDVLHLISMVAFALFMTFRAYRFLGR